MHRNQVRNQAARVLIVDDHPAVREALAFRIGQVADLELCGEGADIADALQRITETKPDLAVVDISLKTGNGIDLIKRIKTRDDHVRILVWSMHSEDLYAERALRAGAMGYITKETATDLIIEALQQIRFGKVFLSPAMTNKLLQRAVGKDSKEVYPNLVGTLSDRELEVFQLIGQATKTAEIAARLHLSVKTIETYRDRIRMKLDLRDSSELLRAAAQWVAENA